MPSKYSLEKYTPFYVSNQGSTSMCVAYALANCRTIIYARNKNITNRDKVFDVSFSPFFLYYILKDLSDDDCVYGVSPWDAINKLTDIGIAKLLDVEYPDYWPFTKKQLCVFYPPSYVADINNAIQYTIDDPKFLSRDLLNFEKVSALKSEISSGNPIFFGMDPFPASLWGSDGYDSWGPNQFIECKGWTQGNRQCKRKVKLDAYCFQHQNQKSSSMGHTMVIIGYDDNKYGGAFQILNSYGKAWGNNGKIWIRYNDLINYSSFFWSVSRRFEAFGSGYFSVEKFQVANDSLTFSSPSFINTNETPPYKDYLKSVTR